MAKTWRLILHCAGTGFYNMAVDEVLFKSYQSTGVPIFRVYSWSEPTLTIGLRQNPAKVVANYFNVPYVKRVTGGGTIYHSNEITYSLVAGKDIFSDRYSNIKETYKRICGFLKLFYRSFNVNAEFACDGAASSSLGELSDFCFKKREHYDLLINGKKIGGNAQRWGRTHFLQHGSIPISSDLRDVISLADITKITDKRILTEKLVASFSAYFDIKFLKSELSVTERAFAKAREMELKAIYEKNRKIRKTILAEQKS